MSHTNTTPVDPQHSSRWLFTCRESMETDLLEELTPARQPVVPTPALVLSQGRPELHPTFARQGFPIAVEAHGDALIETLTQGLAAAWKSFCTEKRRPWHLQSFVPDSDATNPLSARASQLEEQLRGALCQDDYMAKGHLPDLARLRDFDGILLQLCLIAPDHAFAGATRAIEAISLFPGGRARLRMPEKSPSRAALKLEEAFHWIGRSPDPGDLCVDLGACPGGWTYVLLEHRARVITVDPAKLAPHIAANKNVHHVQASAFEFAPPEPVMWLCCDMAWRPLEVAQLLAKWAKKRWASFLVSNIKLPMKKKVEFVQEVTKVLTAGGWRDVKSRQLYHDREEITLSAWRM